MSLRPAVVVIRGAKRFTRDFFSLCVSSVSPRRAGVYDSGSDYESLGILFFRSYLFASFLLLVLPKWINLGKVRILLLVFARFPTFPGTESSEYRKSTLYGKADSISLINTRHLTISVHSFNLDSLVHVSGNPDITVGLVFQSRSK